jgi:hypothetical protein
VAARVRRIAQCLRCKYNLDAQQSRLTWGGSPVTSLADWGRIDMLNRASALASANSGTRAMSEVGAARHWAVAVRTAVVVAALLILYLRMPTTFTNPQFWGEDIDLFYGARVHGWSALSTALAGYLVCAQFLVAILASYFNPVAAPAIYNYAAIVLTLLVVWLVSSPRLQMPAKPLLAIAVVIVPMGYEELGTITNIQWILPIGAFALLFMGAPKRSVIIIGEAILVALTAFSGPFSIFLSPLYAWKLLTVHDTTERRRLAVLTAIMAAGALTQVVMVYQHAEAMYDGEPVPYSPTLWVNLPFSQMLSVFGPVSHLFTGLHGAALGFILFASAIVLALRPPFRMQKIFMILFATAIALGGMYKFRTVLGTQIYATRYYYAGSIFVLWFLCSLSLHKNLRYGLFAIVAVTELVLLPLVSSTPRITNDLEWSSWAKNIDSGLPMIIPTSPRGWYLNLPAAPSGPLAHFASWLGRDVNQMAKPDPAACSGRMGLVLPLDVFHLEPEPDAASRRIWTTRGSAWDTQRGAPAQLVALADQANRVIGFGLSGFASRPDVDSGTLQTEWIGNFLASPGLIVHAEAIVREGERICQVGPERALPTSVVSLASDRFIAALPVTADKEITQSFAPAGKLSGILAQFVARGREHAPYAIGWRIVGSMGGRELQLGSGEIQTGDIREWQPVELPISNVPEAAPQQIQVRFKAIAKTPISVPVGIALFRAKSDSAAPAVRIGDEPAPAGAQLGLTLLYTD